jgi:hypothetical protein
MNPKIIIPLIVIVLASLMFAAAVKMPNSLPVGSDFSALYYADLALVRGVHVYDISKMESLALTTTDIPADKFFMPRFPYPPWYMLSTFYLGLLPIQSAGALWFEINLAMLFLSVWFLTDGWNGRMRLIAFPLSLFFLPALGALSVGQFGFPVLLGTAMLVYSLRKENIPLTVIGVLLLTFKPHLGTLILLSALIWLIANRSSFGRRTMRYVVVAGIIFCIVSLIADPLWFVNYPKMLLNYQGEGNVTSCSECVSLPVYLSRWLFDGSLKMAALIAVILLFVFGTIVYFKRKQLMQSPVLLITSALLITLLVSPYLYNYDFILLLVPFAVIGATQGMASRTVIVLCYSIPSLAIVLFGREANILLLASALTLAVVLFLRGCDDAPRIST